MTFQVGFRVQVCESKSYIVFLLGDIVGNKEYNIWGFPKLGVLSWGPNNRDCSKLGSTLGFPIRETTI